MPIGFLGWEMLSPVMEISGSKIVDIYAITKKIAVLVLQVIQNKWLFVIIVNSCRSGAALSC
jgi:hypothetical protein